MVAQYSRILNGIHAAYLKFHSQIDYSISLTRFVHLLNCMQLGGDATARIGGFSLSPRVGASERRASRVRFQSDVDGARQRTDLLQACVVRGERRNGQGHATQAMESNAPVWGAV